MDNILKEKDNPNKSPANICPILLYLSLYLFNDSALLI